MNNNSSEQQQEKQEGVPVTFTFEAGTTQDDMIRFVDKLRQELMGKVSDEELERFISNYISSIATAYVLCDGCQIEIPKHTHNKCKKCGTAFDLCEDCESEISRVKCPPGFGCNLPKDPNKIFIPLNESKNTEVAEQTQARYEVFGESYLATESKLFNLPACKLLAGFKEATHYPSSVIYFPDKEVPHKLLEDFWLYFRTTDINSLEKYGNPRHPIVELPTYRLYQVYFNFMDCFSRFIAIDDDHSDSSEETLMMRIIYPNGDTFIIKRVYGELMQKVGSPFVTSFIRIADYPVPNIEESTDKKTATDYLIDSFREQLETRLNKTVEELNQTGQVLLIVFDF